MLKQILLTLFACGPLGLALWAWRLAFKRSSQKRPRPITLAGLIVLTMTALGSVFADAYYFARPVPPSVPGWQDPFVLDFVLLGMLASVSGLIVLIAMARESERKIVALLIFIASCPLFLLGVMAGMAD